MARTPYYISASEDIGVLIVARGSSRRTNFFLDTTA
jgi:hypothetical protein